MLYHSLRLAGGVVNIDQRKAWEVSEETVSFKHREGCHSSRGETITLGLYRAVLGPRGQSLWDKWQEQKRGSDLERLLTVLGHY